MRGERLSCRGFHRVAHAAPLVPPRPGLLTSSTLLPGVPELLRASSRRGRRARSTVATLRVLWAGTAGNGGHPDEEEWGGGGVRCSEAQRGATAPGQRRSGQRGCIAACMALETPLPPKGPSQSTTEPMSAPMSTPPMSEQLLSHPENGRDTRMPSLKTQVFRKSRVQLL